MNGLKFEALVVLIAPRIGRNPKTGAGVNLPAKTAIHFKPGKEMRERINVARENCNIQD